LHATLGRWAAAGGVAAVLAIAATVVLKSPEVAEPQPIIAMPQVETTVTIGDRPVALVAIPGTTPGIRIYEVRPN
jgi:hypothetical protein